MVKENSYDLSYLLFLISKEYTVVRYYPYRTRIMDTCICSFNRNDEKVVEIENMLFNRVRDRASQKDNHVMYEIITEENLHLFVYCSDFTVSLGLSVKKGDCCIK